MTLISRVAMWVGAAAILIAVGLAIILKGWEFASWVSAVLGALSLAAGLLARALGADADDGMDQNGGDKAAASDHSDQPDTHAPGIEDHKETRNLSRRPNSVTINNLSNIRGRNQISIGPMTINNNRQSRGLILGFLILFLLLLGFGTYGATTFIAGGNPPPAEPTPIPLQQTSQESPPRAAPTTTRVDPDTAGLGPGAPDPETAMKLLIKDIAWQPQRVCRDFLSHTGRAGFAAAHGTPDCESAAAQLAGQVTDRFAFLKPQFVDGSIVIVGNEAKVDACRLQINSAPELGSFKLTKTSIGWYITAYAKTSATCP